MFLHLAIKAANRTIGPLSFVLRRAKMMLDEKPNLPAHLRLKRHPANHLVVHPRANFSVTVKVHPFVGEPARRNFANVMKKRGPTNDESGHRLLDDQLCVLPHILVSSSTFLLERNRGFDLGHEQLEQANFVQPLKSGVNVAKNEAFAKAIPNDVAVYLAEPSNGSGRTLRDLVERPMASIASNDRCNLEDQCWSLGKGEVSRCFERRTGFSRSEKLHCLCFVVHRKLPHVVER